MRSKCVPARMGLTKRGEGCKMFWRLKRTQLGQVAEWLKATVSKTVIRATVSRVRISPCLRFKTLRNGFESSQVRSGQVSEWFKEHDWNSCGCNSLVGSNPTLSVEYPRFFAAH